MTSSIRSRFGFSLFANFSRAIVSSGTGLLVARGLGPEQFGTMMFLLGTFTAIRQLLDMGSSTAFFTFLSQRQRSRRFVVLYFSWLGVQFLVPLLIVGLIFPDGWIELIWKGEQRDLVMLAFIAAYMQSSLWSVALQMGESQRLTRRVQGVGVAVALVHFLLMVMAWWSGWLGIRIIFILMIVEWGIAVILIITRLRYPVAAIESDTPKLIIHEFLRYCLPLIPYAWLGFAYEFADRWLLQTYAGSIQQAYYSVAFQFGAIMAIATSSVLSIFWKEIAEAYHQNSYERVNLLYRRVSRGLFFIAAAGAGFFAPWAENILRITLGPAYVGGTVTLIVMFFYPLHQSMGQIGGAMAYATGQIFAYVKLGIIFMASSIVATYFVLASPEAALPGLDMGSMGLACKMVIMQILSVNVLGFYLSRSFGIKFDWVFQPLAVLACVVAGLLAYGISHILFDINSQLWIALLVSGIVYAILMLVIIILAPGLAGLCRKDLVASVAMVVQLVHR